MSSFPKDDTTPTANSSMLMSVSSFDNTTASDNNENVFDVRGADKTLDASHESYSATNDATSVAWYDVVTYFSVN